MHRSKPIVANNVQKYLAGVKLEKPNSFHRTRTPLRHFIATPAGSPGFTVGNLRTNRVERAHIDAYISVLRSRSYSAETIKAYVSLVRMYLRWLHSYGLHPLGEAICPPVRFGSPSPVVALSESSLRRVYAVSRQVRSHKLPGRELELWLRLQGDCGLRCAEAWWLSKSEVQGRFVVLRSHKRRLKNPRSARRVPLPDYLLPLIQQRLAGPGQWVFPRAATYPFPGEWTCWQTVNESLQKRLDFHFAPQMLRRAFATRAASVGGLTPWELAAVMGHSNMQTALRYYVAPHTPDSISLPLIA